MAAFGPTKWRLPTGRNKLEREYPLAPSRGLHRPGEPPDVDGASHHPVPEEGPPQEQWTCGKTPVYSPAGGEGCT